MHKVTTVTFCHCCYRIVVTAVTCNSSDDMLAFASVMGGDRLHYRSCNT